MARRQISSLGSHAAARESSNFLRPRQLPSPSGGRGATAGEREGEYEGASRLCCDETRRKLKNGIGTRCTGAEGAKSSLNILGDELYLP